MNKINDIIIAGCLIAFGIIIGLVFGFFGNTPQLAGMNHNVQIDFSEGISVDGTEVIDGDGNWDGAITGTTGTFSSTFGVTGETNVDSLIFGGDVVLLGYGTTTLTAAQICNSSVINIGLAADAMMDLTLPTTAALVADCITADGKHKTVFIRDAATSTLAVTILKGANIDLEGDDTNADVLAAGASVELELYVATSTDTLVGVLRPFTDVD